jgi:hypothetical protein
MKPGGHIVIVSSMAAVNGSPLSGSYAGAKRMQWLMADYAAQEVSREKLDLHIHCLLPTLNPNTDLGRAAVAAYAARKGVTTEEFAKRLAPQLTPAVMGDAIVKLHENPPRWDKVAYRIGGGWAHASCMSRRELRRTKGTLSIQAFAAKRAAEGTQYECHNSNGVDHCTRIHKLPSTGWERQCYPRGHAG